MRGSHAIVCVCACLHACYPVDKLVIMNHPSLILVLLLCGFGFLVCVYFTMLCVIMFINVCLFMYVLLICK